MVVLIYMIKIFQVFLPLVKNIVKYGKSDEIFHNY
jgi:hypothetical protein